MIRFFSRLSIRTRFGCPGLGQMAKKGADGWGLTAKNTESAEEEWVAVERDPTLASLCFSENAKKYSMPLRLIEPRSGW